MKYKYQIFFFTVSLFFIFSPTVHADAMIQINEIAWMGTSTSANAEWIELYNPTSISVDLTGWKLSATDGSPNISLSGTITASGYFLLERTSDATVPGVTANQIYTGALSNSGEHLQLTDPSGAVVDNVDGSGGWPAGDDASKNTMQRSGSSWITAAGTPNSANSATNVPAATQNSNSNNSSATTTSSTVQNDDDSPNQIENTAKSMTEIPVKPDPKFTASAVIPDYATAGVAVSMSIIVHDNGHREYASGKFVWSYGDGASDTFVRNTTANHIFYYPGTYPVTLTYYSAETKEEPDYLFKKTIEIVGAAVSIAGMTDDGGVILSNDSTEDIDLENWKINSSGFQYAFPKYTLIPKGDHLYISSHTLGFRLQSNSATLYNPTNTSISSYGQRTNAQTARAFRTSDHQILGLANVADTEEIPTLTDPAIPQKSSLPEVISMREFLQKHKDLIFGFFAILAIVLAYGGFRLYANRNSGAYQDENDLELDDADDLL
ncbi:MAG: competence protein ComEA [Patescibacteria group bacterium]|nr:competence protein ComEA [Patescibacteria group bacterium]